jgi:ubiquinone/menaquinone biosynthesis C-methylase UbiE
VYVNRLHHWFCRSERWRKIIEQRIPWALEGVELGTDLLELGPGPGLTTELLRSRVERLTAIEIDPVLAELLRLRLRDTNVEVVTGDATALPFSSEQFSSGVSFTMLHHVPSINLQDRVLREVWRVLKSGGIFAGADSLQSFRMRLIHLGDTLVSIDPDTFGRRLESAGFRVMAIEKNERVFRFQARRPNAAVPEPKAP